MKLNSELLVVAGLVLYIAFFTHPPPAFVSMVLKSPVGQVLVLLGVVFAFVKKPLVGLFLGIAYLTSSYPVLEYLDEKDQKPKKEQPKSGAPAPDMEQIGKLAGILGKSGMLGKNGTLPMEKGKDVTAPPPSTAPPKPHVDAKVTEKFSTF